MQLGRAGYGARVAAVCSRAGKRGGSSRVSRRGAEQGGSWAQQGRKEAEQLDAARAAGQGEGSSRVQLSAAGLGGRGCSRAKSGRAG